MHRILTDIIKAEYDTDDWERSDILLGLRQACYAQFGDDHACWYGLHDDDIEEIIQDFDERYA